MNKILQIDFTVSHEECLCSITDYFLTLGFQVDCLVLNGMKVHKLEQLFDKSRVKIMYSSKSSISKRFLDIYKQYNYIYLGDTNKQIEDFPELTKYLTNHFAMVHSAPNYIRAERAGFNCNKLFSIVPFRSKPENVMPMISYGNFEPNIFREFNKSILFTSRRQLQYIDQLKELLSADSELNIISTVDKMYLKEIKSKNTYSWVPLNDFLNLADQCNFIMIPHDCDIFRNQCQYASGSFQVARALGIIPCFKGSPKCFDFPDDACIVYKDIPDLVYQLENITIQEYVRKQINLIKDTEDKKQKCLKMLRKTFKIK